MSRGQVPRTPANFPKMKDRAAGRRARREAASAVQVFASIAQMGQAIGEFVGRALDALVQAVTAVPLAIAELLTAAAEATQDDYALAAPADGGSP